MKRLVSAFILLIIAVPVFAEAGEYSPDQIKLFTRYLIKHKEYYRALVELKRLKSMSPGYLPPAAFNVTENYLLFHGNQFKDILSKSASVSGPVPAALDSLFRYDAAIALRDYGQAETILASWGPAEPYLDRCLKKRRLFSCLVARRYGEAPAFCGALAGPDFSACRELIDQARIGFSREKKPWLAAVMGIVPGMGYIYSGEYATGIFALLLISIDALMTYFAFRTHNDVIGYFTGVIGGFFYAGSIAGGYLAAQRFNVGLTDSMGSSLSGDLRFDRDREEILSRHGIGKD